ncbi:hypothetical protein B0H12DRAFT_1117388 [Mycena haematopus]|nr:hypothetical protein B0H12DRAFT_1117388 [Mycena haematopus]
MAFAPLRTNARPLRGREVRGLGGRDGWARGVPVPVPLSFTTADAASFSFTTAARRRSSLSRLRRSSISFNTAFNTRPSPSSTARRSSPVPPPLPDAAPEIGPRAPSSLSTHLLASSALAYLTTASPSAAPVAGSIWRCRCSTGPCAARCACRSAVGVRGAKPVRRTAVGGGVGVLVSCCTPNSTRGARGGLKSGSTRGSRTTTSSSTTSSSAGEGRTSPSTRTRSSRPGLPRMRSAITAGLPCARIAAMRARQCAAFGVPASSAGS